MLLDVGSQFVRKEVMEWGKDRYLYPPTNGNRYMNLKRNTKYKEYYLRFLVIKALNTYKNTCECIKQ